MSVFLRPHRESLAPGPSSGPDRRQQAVAVLTGARSVLARGWLQGAWYVLEAPDGRRRVVGTGSLTRRDYGAVVQACLVGAVVEAGRWHSGEAGAGGPAIDELWCALQGRAGHKIDSARLTPSPWARRLRAQELIRWNDDETRTRDDAFRLLDAAIARAVPAYPVDVAAQH